MITGRDPKHPLLHINTHIHDQNNRKNITDSQLKTGVMIQTEPFLNVVTWEVPTDLLVGLHPFFNARRAHAEWSYCFTYSSSPHLF